MRTCGPAPRRSARWRSSDPTEQRKRSPGSVAMGQADRDRDWCNGKTRKTTQNCKRKRDDAADGGRQSSTQKDADSAPGGAVQALKSDDNGQDCRWWKMVEGRLVTSLGSDLVNLERGTTPARVLPRAYAPDAAGEQLEWCWLTKKTTRTVRATNCARIVTLVTNARCCDGDRAACDFYMRSACEGDRSRNRRDRPPVNALMGCTVCCESMAAEIAYAVSLGNGFAH